ncbi:hypothetical protein AMATHDRAFT_136511 [Amanita thiersii Skay4041]|uniref:Late embryogenesis abundant protein LEA-2 subgroup domain-containing protein n=1 Tax=Amanita thiersii Skay4041 TaxID=703135 RepID=A0A2A9NSR4_9AGAR|nr:hypothetical protein AMATHDRAFT_136511 [Amanita thiersii Skay4041]
MDYDRKSTVSSFYGAPKTSLDALNADFVAHPPNVRARDDASSFFNGDNRMSTDLHGPRANAGYNRNSFFHAGREEPVKGGRDEEEEVAQEAWDVYADFNNAGPRYSHTFGQNSQGYQQLPPLSPNVEEVASTNNVEMVTVPALGPEWSKDEMRGMTKAGKNERRAETRREKWKAWNRGERGMCGHYCTKKVFVFVVFGVCIAIGIVLAFTVPRVPIFGFNSDSPLVNATGAWGNAVPFIFSRFPANFSFPANAALQVNTHNNYVPITFNHIKANVFDLQTSRLVATGDLGHKTFPAKKYTNLLLPLNFTYIASNDTDQTWANWYNACKNRGLYTDGKRQPVQYRILLTMNILGLPNSRSTSTEVSDAECPVELPMNAG